MHVWIITDFKVLKEALTKLVTGLGFIATAADGPEVEVALAYLTRAAPRRPTPCPPRCQR